MRREYESDGSLFENEDALTPSGNYRPDDLPERQNELDQIYSAIRPIQNNATPHNLLVYGETGQGKTEAVKLEISEFQQWVDQNRDDISLTYIYISCKGMNKSHNTLTTLLKKLRDVRTGEGTRRPTGYTRKRLRQMVVEEMEKIGGTFLVVLDEIDSLGHNDYILYELPRANMDNAKLGVIGITNDLTYTDNLDGDVLSSLGEDEVIFSPYTSSQLETILRRRSSVAFIDTGFSCADCNDPTCPHDVEQTKDTFVSDVVTDSAISTAAKYAGEEMGDTRDALKLLQRGARQADENGDSVITETHIDQAQEYYRREAIATGIKKLPINARLSLLAVVAERTNGSEWGKTSTLFSRYQDYCEISDVNPRTNKRFREFLNHLVNTSHIRKKMGKGTKENTYALDIDIDLLFEHFPREERYIDIVEELETQLR